MKRFSLVVPSLAAFMLSVPAFADNSINTSVPFSETLVNPCNGENVAASGLVHININITTNGNGLHAMMQSNPQGVTGIGETTGATYHGTGVGHENINISSKDGSFTDSYVLRVDFIGNGQVPNFEFHETAHITVNADGTIIVNFDNIGTTCH